MPDSLLPNKTFDSNATEVSTHLSEIIPDVLAKGNVLTSKLIVKWPGTTLDEPGTELDYETTQAEPTLYISPVPEEKHNDYVLAMVDPDLFKDNDTNFGQVRHWLATNISIGPDGQLDIPKPGSSDNISPYVGPAPLPNYISPRPHRYVFIISRPKSSGSRVNVQASDIQALQKDYTPALEGQQQAQDLIDRWGFNVQKFCEMKNLRPEAATFVRVGGSLKSAVANAGMTLEAGVNKVLGK